MGGPGLIVLGIAGVGVVGNLLPAAEPGPATGPVAQAGVSAEELSARDALLEALVERVRPAPATRPFARGELRVPCVTTPAEDVTGMLAELWTAEQDLLSGGESECWARSEALSEQLALLPWRHGASASTLPGWERLQREAAAVLARLEARPERLLERDTHGELLRALLLELAGRQREAAEVLGGVQASHVCGNCADNRHAAIGRRRSELAERQGRTDEALALLLAGLPSTTEPLRLLLSPTGMVRLGLLLLDAGQAPQGCALLQLVVDLFPRTQPAEVAGAALEVVGARIEPTAERLDRYASDEGLDPWLRARAQLALRYESDDQLLSELIARCRAGDAEALAELGASGDERARPLLLAALVDTDVRQLPGVLSALPEGRSHIKTGAWGFALLALRRIEEAPVGVDLVALDKSLRELLDRGPKDIGAEPLQLEPLAAAWRLWVAERRGGRP